MFLACEHRHINIAADMSMHAVVNRHDSRSSMKRMQNADPSQEKVLTVCTMEKRPG